jgi:flagellar protein FliO/FliZ
VEPADNIWQVALALTAIVGLVVLLGFVAKRFQSSKSSGTGQLKIVDSAYLGPKERLVLVQIGDQNVLVGMNPQCITKLAQYETDTEFAGVLKHATSNATSAGTQG